MVPDPPKAELIRSAFEDVASGVPAADALRDVTVRGLRTRARSARFASDIRVRPEELLDVGRLESRRWAISRQGDWEPIVSPDVFARVQAFLRRKPSARQRVAQHPDFPLRRFVRCACGRRMTGSWSGGRSRRYAFYHCPNSACGERARKADLEDKFLSLVRMLQPNEDYAALFNQLLREAATDAAANVAARKASIAQRVSQLEGRLRILKDKFLYTDALPESLYIEESNLLGQQLMELRQEMLTAGGTQCCGHRESARLFEASLYECRSDLGACRRGPETTAPTGVLPRRAAVRESGNFRTGRISFFFRDIQPATEGIGEMWRPQRDSNPCFSLERATS